jgi:hypothetical protein
MVSLRECPKERAKFFFATEIAEFSEKKLKDLCGLPRHLRPGQVCG